MDRAIHQFRAFRASGDGSPSAQAASWTGGSGKVGVIRNANSHRNKARAADLAGRAEVVLMEPDRRAATGVALAELAAMQIDYLVIDGGDGTVRDVLTQGASIFGDRWPTIAIVPSGKTNALAVDLGMPGHWRLGEAIDAIREGGRIHRHPLCLASLDGLEGVVLGFILGAGLFTSGTEAGQSAHRWGAFDSFAVGLTSALTILRSLFGRGQDAYRRGVGLHLRLWPGDRELEHCGPDTDRRLLLLASTLQRFPLGMRPFGKLREGLRVATIDAPRRRLLAALPLAIYGLDGRWMDKGGFRRRWVESFEFAIDDRFILDGEAFPAGRYRVSLGPELRFVTP